MGELCSIYPAQARRAVAAMEETMDSVQSIDPLQLQTQKLEDLRGK